MGAETREVKTIPQAYRAGVWLQSQFSDCGDKCPEGKENSEHPGWFERAWSGGTLNWVLRETSLKIWR